MSRCWWSRNDTLHSKPLKHKSLTHLHHLPNTPLHDLCNHQSNPTRYYVHFTEELNDVPSHEWQPRIQTWPPGAQSAAGGTENHPRGCTEGRAAAPQTAGFSLAPKNLQAEDRFLIQGIYRNKQAGTPSAPSSGRVGEQENIPPSNKARPPANGISWNPATPLAPSLLSRGQWVHTSRLAQFPEYLLQVPTRLLLALKLHGQQVKDLSFQVWDFLLPFPLPAKDTV